ncbi:MAG: hypothetical protein O2884_14935, partial [Chloroflexi bacterium]|nr:hypothetical protein [Chloroflexota bacterium]
VIDETPIEPMVLTPADNTPIAQDEPPMAVDTPVAQAEPPMAIDTPAEPAPAPPVVDTPVAQDQPPVAVATNGEAPVMARNLFNEMQEIPRPPSEDDGESDADNESKPMAAAALPSNQIPADYYPGPDEEEMNV